MLSGKDLRGWGASEAVNLKVLTREAAPDLKDKKAWEDFPVKDFDVLIIDSVGSFTRGGYGKGRQRNNSDTCNRARPYPQRACRVAAL